MLNGTKEEHRVSFERPVLHDRFGIAPSSEYRDGDVTAVVCDDSGWPLET